MEMANIFGGYRLYTRPSAGDSFSILYDEKYLDGAFVGHNDILVTQFINQGRTFTAIRYINRDGELVTIPRRGEYEKSFFETL